MMHEKSIHFWSIDIIELIEGCHFLWSQTRTHFNSMGYPFTDTLGEEVDIYNIYQFGWYQWVEMSSCLRP